MRKNYLLLLAIGFVTVASAQIYNDGAVIHIESGAVVYSEGDVTVANSGTVTNLGLLTTLGNYANDATTNGGGQYEVFGHWTNTNTFTHDNSRVSFLGDTDSDVTSGSDDFFEVYVGKDAGINVNLLDNAKVDGDLKFDNDNNKVIIGNNDLTIDASGIISDYDDNDYVITDGTGSVIKNNLDMMTYPVGYDASTYNPLTLDETTPNDNIGVRCLENVLDNGITGTPYTEGSADASWEVTEDVQGGSDITMTAQWVAPGDELPNFDNSNCAIARHLGTPNDWDATYAMMGAATGGPIYTRDRAGVDELGVFAVTSNLLNPLRMNISAILQGPYNAGNNDMNDLIRLQNLLPTTEPYSDLATTSGNPLCGIFLSHSGTGGGEMATPTAFDNNGPNSTVDWVMVEIRDADDSTNVITSKSGLIQKDFNIVDLDGVSCLTIPGYAEGDYFVSIKHRNHLGVMSATPISLGENCTDINFTDGSVTTYIDPTPPLPNCNNPVEPMLQLPNGLYALYAGNVTCDNVIRATGPLTVNDFQQIFNFLGTNLFVPSVYSVFDINMDGSVRRSGPLAINDAQLFKSFIVRPINIICQHMP